MTERRPRLLHHRRRPGPRDTNEAQDVYEYVDGRPQLITPGTGDTRSPLGGASASTQPGLIGVSADGRDVYFSTYDTLVRQDHNGLFLKFYDARAGGGFPAPAPPPPCTAADECHGAGSAAAASGSPRTALRAAPGRRQRRSATRPSKQAPEQEAPQAGAAAPPRHEPQGTGGPGR